MSGDHGSLEKYLHTMSRLKGALDYFEKNNPQSIELENVRTLYELGRRCPGKRIQRANKETFKVSLIMLDQGWPDFFDRRPNLKIIFHHGPHYSK
jgi:hypothetical protein